MTTQSHRRLTVIGPWPPHVPASSRARPRAGGAGFEAARPDCLVAARLAAGRRPLRPLPRPARLLSTPKITRTGSWSSGGRPRAAPVPARREDFPRLALSVSPDVLVPRPETEGIDRVVAPRCWPAARALVVAISGTGSGAIAFAYRPVGTGAPSAGGRISRRAPRGRLAQRARSEAGVAASAPGLRSFRAARSSGRASTWGGQPSLPSEPASFPRCRRSFAHKPRARARRRRTGLTVRRRSLRGPPACSGPAGS